MAIDVLRPCELTPGHVRAWRAFQAADPDAGSPFLTPDWVQAVERARAPGRLRVAVEHGGGEPRAFLAVRAGTFTALPAGAPLSDYHGVVAAPGGDADMPALLRALGVSRYDFTSAPLSQRALAAGVRGRDVSRRVDVSLGGEGFAARLKAQGSDLLRDTAKRRRKMEREVGPVTLTWRDRDRDAFDRFVALKREQHRETRQTDVLGAPWVRRLFDDLWTRDDPAFGAMFSTLRIDGRLAAGHLGLGAGTVMHAWFIAHDGHFARYSPGMVLISELTRHLAETGWHEFDLGPGDYAFKDRMCDAGRAVGHGFVGRPSPAAAFRGAAYGVRRWAEDRPLGRWSALPGKAMRRWDVIRALG